jgi:1-acyl-sn-glycerol-3-phosphate acyltransferase
MDLVPHLGAFLRGGPVDAVVAWGEPIRFDADGDRKRAASEAEAAVRDSIRRVAAARRAR